MNLKDEGIGFVSYEWKGAPSGVIDASSGGQALLGLDDAIRYFNRRQSAGFGSTSYEIPVLTGNGSWVAVVLGILAVPAAAFSMAYAKKAGEKMAEKDFSDIGFKDVARKSMDALVKFIRLVKIKKGKFDIRKLDIEWSEDATTAIVRAENGEHITVPAEYIRWYATLPAGTLKRLCTPIASGREMTVGARQDDGSLDAVTFDEADRLSLTNEDTEVDPEFLFPDLIHGTDVILEGIVTRGNQSTNSMGLQYRGHILNCIPGTGSVKRFKPALFEQCKVYATINRHVASLATLDYRPTLLVDNIISTEDRPISQQDLF
ncbi:hypothetical protein D3C81_615810 [compost metagenome]